MVAAVADCAPQVVLNFWFQETKLAQWWSAEPAFDTFDPQPLWRLARPCGGGRAVGLAGQGAHGRLGRDPGAGPVLPQPGRGTPLAFAQDGMALVLAQEAVAAGRRLSWPMPSGPSS